MKNKKLERWMPMFWTDYWKDTTGLSCSQHGAYLNLIGECWVKGGLLPADDDELWRLARADGPKHWQQIKAKVVAKFVQTKDGYRHKRIDLELTKQTIHLERQRAKGQNGANKRWHKDGRTDNRGDDQPIAGSMAQASPKPADTIAGAMHRQWPDDGTLSLKGNPPYPPSESGGAPPGPRGRGAPTPATRIGGLKRMAPDTPTPEEFAEQQKRVLAECVAAGLLPGAKS